MSNFSIAVTGLPQAGKTSFTQRLLSGIFVSSSPTLGVDVEFAVYQGHPIQIWDMGGHEAFRKHIWKNYVKLASALIFIFDASNLDNISEGKEWFYNSLEWIEKDDVPVLFLGNKMDLINDREEAINKIVEGFELNKLIADEGKRSFRFFFVSVKTGEYISEAMNWLFLKLERQHSIVEQNVIAIDIFLKQKDVILHIHDNNPKRQSVTSMIDIYWKKWFNSEHQTDFNSFEEINLQDFKILFFEYAEIALLVITNKEYVEKSPFLRIVEKLKTIQKIDLEKEENRFELFDRIKKELTDNFMPSIANTATCQIVNQKQVD